LVIRRSFSPADIGLVLREILTKVYGYVVSNQLTIAGAPVCCYKEWTEQMATVEAGLPIAGPAHPEAEFIRSSIPAGTYASVIHEGSYDTIDQAHQAIETWLQQEGLRADTDVFEVYLTDPDEHPDPANWQTQVMRRLL
jgi:effector-binding domain-containing protein